MWLKREKPEESVTLTLMIVSFAGVMVGSGLEMAGVVKSTSILFETFGACVAMYLGRKINFRGQTFDATKEASTTNEKRV